MLVLAEADFDLSMIELRCLAESILDEELKGQSRTAQALKDQLESLPGFRGLGEDAWLKIGQAVKPLGLHTSVFTGAIGVLMKYLSSGGRFPASPDWLASKGFKAPKYESPRTQAILNKDELLEPFRLSALEALENKSVQRTKQDDEEWSASEKTRIMVWSLGDRMSDVYAAMRSGGAKIGEETVRR